MRAGKEHDAAVTKLGDDGFARAGRELVIWHGNFAAVPVDAVIVAINDRTHGVGVWAALRGGDPHGDDEAAVAKLDAVSGSRGDDAPRPVGAKGLEGGGDFNGLRPGRAVVVTADAEGPQVLEAVE